MRRRLKRKQDSAEVNMTPMLDIVFILLIFFIVTATFLQEKGLQLYSPPSDEENEPQDDTPSILIQVDERNLVFVDFEATDVSRVAARVQRKMVDTGGRAAVVIQSHPDSQHGVVMRVQDQAREVTSQVVVRKPE